MDQSSFQHDKCQVGDIHTYHGDLVHLHTFFLHHPYDHSYDHISHDYFHHSVIQSIIHENVHTNWAIFRIFMIVPEPVSIAILCSCNWLAWELDWRSGLSSPWHIEEAGCQAHEKFSGWENCWGLISWRCWTTTIVLWDFMSALLLKPGKEVR